MLLLSILVFLGIIVGVTINMMASFMPFLDQINDIENYYNSYYGAVSSLEQWLLASKYKQAGFSATGENENTIFWIKKNIRLKKMKRKVNSKTNQIADNNINYMYSEGNQNNKYSKLDYNKVVAISLKLDKSKKFSNQEEDKDNQTTTQTINTSFKTPAILGNKHISKINDKIQITKTDLDQKNNIQSGLNIITQDNMFYIWIDDTIKTDNNKKIPLLEFLLDFQNNEVGDKKFDIKGKGVARDYITELNIEKSTKDILSPKFKKTLFPTE